MIPKTKIGSNYTKVYGKAFEKDGVLWYHTLPFYARMPFTILSGFQWLLWKMGIPWHMPSFGIFHKGGQCTPNGNCCKGKEF